MNINKLSSFFVLLLFSASIGSSYAIAGSHQNPLNAISTISHHDEESTAKTKPLKKPARHFSPLQAISGNIIKKKSTEKNIDYKNPKIKNEEYFNRKKRYRGFRKNIRKRDIRKSIDDMINSAKTDGDYIEETSSDTMNSLGFSKKERNRDQYTNINNKMGDNNNSSPAGHTKKAKKTDDAVAMDVGHIKVDGDIGSESPTGDVLKSIMASQKYSGDTSTNPNMKKIAKKALHPGTTKTLYLTFDDGPCGGTANVLRTIKEEGINATVFYIGRNVLRSPSLFHRAVNMPNVMVSNHTFSHANGHYRRFYNSPAQNVIDDIDRAQHAIGGAKYLRLCGRNVWRLPHIRRNDHGIKSSQRAREIGKYDALSNRGYYIYGWDVEWHFSYKNQRPIFGGEEMARRVNLVYSSGRLARRGKVVLLAHDFMWRSRRSVEELKIFLHIMKAQGWRFDTIDNYSNTTPSVFVKRGNSKTGKFTKMKKAALLQGIKKANNKTESLGDAIRRQDFLKIRKLLAKGVDINAKDVNGEIPLNIAIGTNNAVLVKMLVERGARIFNIDGRGMSPMGIAKQHHNTIIIKYLQKQIDLQKRRKLKKMMHFAFSR